MPTRWEQQQRLSVYVKCRRPNFAHFSASLLSQVRELYRKREEEVRKEARQSGHRRRGRQPKHRRRKEGLPEASGLKPDRLGCIFKVKRLLFTSMCAERRVECFMPVWMLYILFLFLFFLKKRCIFMMLWDLHNVCRMRRPSLKHTHVLNLFLLISVTFSRLICLRVCLWNQNTLIPQGKFGSLRFSPLMF